MESEIGKDIAEGLTAPEAAVTPAPQETQALAAESTATPPAELTVSPAPASAAADGQPAAVTAESSKPDVVPLPAFLDMRDENKKLKARLADLEAKSAQQPATPPPSFKDDPEGYAARIQDEASRAVVNARFDWSEEVANEKYGKDAVDAAKDWGMNQAEGSQAFAAEYLRQKNPISWIVKQHKQHQLQSEIGDDVDAFVRKRAAALGLVAPAPAVPPSPQPQATAAAAPATSLPAVPAQTAPTRSLASAPSAGGPNVVPTGPFAAFEGLTRS